MEWLIIGIIASVVGTATTIAQQTIERRKGNRQEFEFALLNGPVYLEGMQYEAAKTYYLELYKRDPAMFVKVYNEIRSKRFSEGLDGKQDIVRDNKTTVKYAIIILGIIFLIFIANGSIKSN